MLLLRHARNIATECASSRPNSVRIIPDSCTFFAVVFWLAEKQLSGFNISHAGIELDATPPAVVDLYSPKQTSPWGGVYTVGEEVKTRAPQNYQRGGA